MNNQELYKRTVDILVNAYLNDTLRHGNCRACAVGNIVGANLSINNVLEPDEWNRISVCPTRWEGWPSVFITSGNNQRINSERYEFQTKRQIDATGYTWQELAKIEYAFETAPKGKSDDEWMFNGLMAVIDVLDDIHDNKDSEVTIQTKKRFDKALS